MILFTFGTVSRTKEFLGAKPPMISMYYFVAPSTKEITKSVYLMNLWGGIAIQIEYITGFIIVNKAIFLW